jgi:hypothetical protein
VLSSGVLLLVLCFFVWGGDYTAAVMLMMGRRAMPACRDEVAGQGLPGQPALHVLLCQGLADTQESAGAAGLEMLRLHSPSAIGSACPRLLMLHSGVGWCRLCWLPQVEVYQDRANVFGVVRLLANDHHRENDALRAAATCGTLLFVSAANYIGVAPSSYPPSPSFLPSSAAPPPSPHPCVKKVVAVQFQPTLLPDPLRLPWSFSALSLRPPLHRC